MEKAALFVVYCGAGYKGMQRNPGAATIEGVLEEALVRAGAIGSNGCSRNWLDWKRAARTDKEVSALGQVVSARLYLTPDLVHRTNEFLPGSIRLLGFKRVPDDFSAKKMCASRRYEYVLPIFAFDPRTGDDLEEEFLFDFERFNQILGRFLGTDHSFHNFSWRVRPGDREARRTVVEFRAADKIWIGGSEFVRIIVLARSFMAYQIRKMVGLAVAVMRDIAPVTTINRALRSEVDVIVPTAPEVGLLLDESFYHDYNAAASTPEESRIALGLEFGEAMQEFKSKVIYAHIAHREREQGIVAKWLPSLNAKNYSALSIC
ncbi:hypothetical protein SELMODRAFT_124462 [Selaginella moellendorffii]|uniref:Pseudouridine synthase I TruA alpha/beta domain-containing protein n=1 Tax=Selaginella moellendorffii TaxID=88036 RepID=D8STK6_SELML|nr:tRNA pseudouridine synthase A [Selaginella moellendorffii]EFJ12278.1 hypothetical protein SELMODRAFT_124462 [Selaginella moellendorffii]|eukprot:XP_002986715.1 tRNA pseudouridine synthase A [Selaginella moellendorffii]